MGGRTYYTNDPISDWERHVANEDPELSKYPTCDWCGHHMDEGYELPNGENVCEDCIDKCRTEYEPEDITPEEYWG